MDAHTLTRDRLSVLGVVTGVVLVLVGLATLAGTPWNYAGSGLEGGLQALGAVGALAVGAALAWVATR